MSKKKQDLYFGMTEEEMLLEASKIEAEIEHVHLKEHEADKERVRSAILTEIYQLEQEEKQKQKKTTTQRKILRYAAGFAIALLGIFGISMTSQANRTYLVEKVQEIFRDDADVRIENDEMVAPSDNADIMAREEIESVLEVPVPEFYYMPDGFEFVSYEIYEDAGIAEICYSDQEQVIIFQISGNDEDTAENRSVDGIIIENYILKMEYSDVEVMELGNQVNNDKSYYAHWLYKNAYYHLYGKMGNQEMEKILKNLMY